jgi:hypothetical protein
VDFFRRIGYKIPFRGLAGLIMRQEQLDSLYRWFQGYVGGFSSDNARVQAHLKLKQQHTYRVCAEMRHLVHSLALPDRDARIAEAIALLHDTGRFEQFVQYQTFMDSRSENHCLLGLRILAEHKVLYALDEAERQIIEKAIEFHGAMELPNLPADTILFARLIRDADKIDIFHIVIKNYKEYLSKPEGFVLEVAFLDTPGCTPEVAAAVLARRPIDYRDLKTIDDVKLMQLGWVFDVNFPAALVRIRDRGYLDELVHLLPDTPEMARLTGSVMDYVEQAIQQGKPGPS